MKKLFILLALLVAMPASASLWNYYGGNLPSVSDRAPEALRCDITGYSGTYDQNIKLESCLRNNSVLGGGATTSTVPSSNVPYLNYNNTWTRTNTFHGNLVSTGTNSFSGNNTFTGTTTLATTTVPNIITMGTTTTSTLAVNQKFVSDFTGYDFSSSSQPSRAINTTYHNSSAKTLFVTISFKSVPPTNISYNAYCDISANGLPIARVGMTGGELADTTESNPKRSSVSFFVAPNQDYGTVYTQNGNGSVTIESWIEWSNK